jgi:hypothetical protein
MATITTELDDDGEVLMLMECETSGAFSKSASEIKADPTMAFKNSVNAIAIMCRSIADKVAPQLEGSGLAFDAEFAIKTDAMGGIMIAVDPTKGQIKVTVRYQEQDEDEDEDY